MPNSIQVRPARADDKTAVVAFCQNTFSWGDYIPEVYDKWLVDDEGKLLVATVEQQPVGLAHVGFLGNGVGWMEGMRVHPDYRLRGIGTELDRIGRQVARENGCRLARLVTSMKNIPAQKSLVTQGYHRTAQFNEWETEPAREDFSNARVATENDIPQILSIWNESNVREASRTVIPNRYWRWKEIDEARMRRKIAANEVRVADNGFAIITASDEGDWNGLIIYALAGNEQAMFDIAHAVGGEAAYRGYAHVEATLADYAPLNDALQRAGYRTDGGIFLYEQDL
ncbi:MAG: GNAT family N-acetyltransferase [Chloroflexi bacterium]|nr:GNAT family N-acetyltransferase [Chloroflexota bacterium]